MDPKTFNALRSLVYEKSGISLGDNKKALVCSRIGKRIRQLGLDDFKDYLKYLNSDEKGREVVELLDVISTNVTNFFREPKHFEVLSSLLKKWAGAGQRRFRIWCAASSTGEEPYTIAMTVREALNDVSDTKILATDISTQVLEKAVKGVYEERHVEKIPGYLLSRYFKKIRRGDSEGLYEASQSLKQMLTFRRLNLNVTPYPLKGPLDVVFIRNVMIYFDNQVRAKVLKDMYRLLKPGGYLMVGHSESLTGLVSEFKSVMPSVYIKQ
ncbi:MAG: protein-glutamate O-methyltransferase [Gemmatimonadota bacterium]|nr:protein-glutamate O-methyltransferase [Gemmatimonadota bacterium]